MNFYLYVICREGKGNFLAATVNERKAIANVVMGLKNTYPRAEGWNGVNVFEGSWDCIKEPIHIFEF